MARADQRHDDVHAAGSEDGDGPEHLPVDPKIFDELMDHDPPDGDPRTGQHRGPRRRGRAALPVQPADDHRARAAGEDRAGDGEEQKDVLALLEQQAEQKNEDCDAANRQAQRPDVLAGAERLLP